MKKIIKNILLCNLLLTTFLLAQKTDIIHLKNGDYITGEIRSLNYGMLEYKTDGMSTLSVKWDHVTQIKSKYKFEVTLDEGGVYLAYMDTTANLNEVNLIINNDVSFIVELRHIVEILQIKDKFWGRFGGSFYFGLNYTKGSNIFYYDLSGDLRYREYKYDASFKFSSNLTDDKNNGNVTTKRDASLTWNGQLKNYWFYTGSTSAEENSQLGLKLRTAIGGGMGRNLLYTHKSTMQISTSLVANREWPIDGEEQNNLEGLLYLEYRIFNNAPPKTKLVTFLGVYPSFTTWGRVRTKFEIEGSIEIWTDFVYKLKLYYSQDNQPISIGAEELDWGITTSVGYSFN